MKKVFIAIMILSGNTWADLVKLMPEDSKKLTAFLDKLPAEVRKKNTKTIYTPVKGILTTTRFPKSAAPFSISCSGRYFNESQYASSALCEFEVNINHPDFEKGYDEYRLIISNVSWLKALMATIPYGIPKKELYSYGMDTGTRFEGVDGNVFHYHFTCDETACEIRVSALNLKDN